MVTYLTPCVPLSFKGEGGELFKRGEASLGTLCRVVGERTMG